jgi:pimeloyl-ACP methyl ester carboxylesterase
MSAHTAERLRGVAAERPAVLFLHGGGANRGMWAAIGRRLAGDHHVIAIDLPGHGACRHEPFRMADAVKAAAEAIDRQAAGCATVVGMSVGGYVAISLAAARPGSVAGLILSGASAQYLGWGGLTTRLAALPFRIAPGRLESMMVSQMRTKAPREVADELLAGGLSMRGAADSLWRVPGRDYHRLLEEFDGPVLLLNGERDRENRREEAEVLRRCRNATAITIADAGHSAAILRPEPFADAVRDFVALRARSPSRAAAPPAPASPV